MAIDQLFGDQQSLGDQHRLAQHKAGWLLAPASIGWNKSPRSDEL
jgi:hypothetical protein